jgi:hypothetical protein
MKFRDIVQGKRATKVIPLPIGEGENQVALRFLDGDEQAEILEKGAEFAKERGVKDPKAGDQLYDFGCQIYTVLYGCVDPDNLEAKGQDARFFSSEKEILGASNLGRDGIAFLAEAQEAWQEHCSPRVDNANADFWRQIEELATSSDPLGFVALRPISQWRLARTMASLLWKQLLSRSSSGSPSESDGAPSSKKTSSRKRGGRKAGGAK